MVSELQSAFNYFKKIEDNLATLETNFLLGKLNRNDYLKRKLRLKKEFKLAESNLMDL